MTNEIKEVVPFDLFYLNIVNLDEKISPNELMLLYSIYKEDKNMFTNIKDRCKSEHYFKESLYWILRKHVVNVGENKYEVKFENLQLKNNSLFNDVVQLNIEKEIEPQNNLKLEFIDFWYDLFPKGVRSGGQLVRSGKSGALKRMLKFKKEYPEFTDEVILGATENYIKRYKLSGYKYMKIAGYFISKDGSSSLASECEGYIDNKTNKKEVAEVKSSGASDTELL